MPRPQKEAYELSDAEKRDLVKFITDGSRIQFTPRSAARARTAFSVASDPCKATR